MYVCKLRLEGRLYRETVHDDGSRTYDPPLPAEIAERSRGQWSNNIHEIAETGQFPGVRTDTAFLGGRGTLLEQMGGDEAWTKHVVKQARLHGYSPGANDTYITQLARFPGDPEAFLQAGEGRGHIAKICEKRGAGCQGAVEVRGREEAAAPVRLAEDLVQEKVKQYRAVGDDSPLPELRNRIIEKHGAKV